MSISAKPGYGVSIRFANFYCPEFTERPDGSIGQHVWWVGFFLEAEDDAWDKRKKEGWRFRSDCPECQNMKARIEAL